MNQRKFVLYLLVVIATGYAMGRITFQVVLALLSSQCSRSLDPVTF